MRRLIILALWCCALAASAQGDWQEYLVSLYENDSDAAMAMEEAYEYLTELERKPLDINTVTSEQLLQIPSLQQHQVDEIMKYRSRYGEMRAIDELTMIRSIDPSQRLFLAHFLCVPEKDRRHSTSHDLTLTATVPTYYRAGDRGSGSEKYGNRYLGDPVRHSLRYSLTVGDWLDVNITGAKNAGEPFFSHGNDYGYDHYAFNAVIYPYYSQDKDTIGTSRNGGGALSYKRRSVPFMARVANSVQKIILGQFRASFGLGLVLNNRFSLSKQATASSLNTTGDFTPFSSTSDSKHLQGIATVVELGQRCKASAFWSYRYIDATLDKDNGTITTILTSYYHRTANDMSKKNNAAQMTTGAHVAYSIVEQGDINLKIGASVLYTRLSRSLEPVKQTHDSVPDSRRYRYYYPRGSRFWNASIDYCLNWKRLSLTGETATGDCGALATLNALSMNVSDYVTLSAVQRYYAYQYYSLYGSSFSEGGAVQNESGVMLGTKWQPNGRLTVDAYADVAYFPWWRYLVSSSSYVWDGALSAAYSHKQWTFAMRYRIKSKERDGKNDKGEKVITNRLDQRLRFTASLNSTNWTAKTQLETCLMQYDDDSRGFIASQSVGYKMRRTWSFYIHAAYFTTDDYDSRLYTYERGMNYSFGYSSYYGNGMRAALLVKADLGRHFAMTAKVANTRYFDRSTIGSAERTIYSNNQTDIDLQLHVRF